MEQSFDIHKIAFIANQGVNCQQQILEADEKNLIKEFCGGDERTKMFEHLKSFDFVTENDYNIFIKSLCNDTFRNEIGLNQILGDIEQLQKCLINDDLKEYFWECEMSFVAETAKELNIQHPRITQYLKKQLGLQHNFLISKDNDQMEQSFDIHKFAFIGGGGEYHQQYVEAEQKNLTALNCGGDRNAEMFEHLKSFALITETDYNIFKK